MTLILSNYILYSQHPQPTDPTIYCPLVWDLRESPASSARHVSNLQRSLSSRELSQPASFPSVSSLTITCNLFPDTWSIQAENAIYVTVHDVLHAIYTSLYMPLKREEWDSLSRRQHDLVQSAFERRCRNAINPEECAAAGKMRIDYLAHHIIFGGLSASLEDENTCILSLRRLPA
ncbi:hypothetical protein FA15DRAFT_702686 [Coprinopsis marcescibilis]|uniref:DUF6699 domain-containing protein n=1 Tax=Coprinopsis marcescibilis TaxID=230819 RepID=A0A5C3L317_COPMA|nr:hypothetical protein FA15DRAFT_702686 [Coprinopsis marcescibilis]